MFKDRLKELRLKQGYTMDEMCKKYNKMFNAKMNKSTLSRYENGLQEPRYIVLNNLSEFFGVPFQDLLGNSSSSYFKDIAPYIIQKMDVNEAFEEFLVSLGFEIELLDHNSYLIKDFDNQVSFIITENDVDKLRSMIIEFTRFEIYNLLSKSEKYDSKSVDE